MNCIQRKHVRCHGDDSCVLMTNAPPAWQRARRRCARSCSTAASPQTRPCTHAGLKAKGGVDEAEACLRYHAAWRAEQVPAGRILEVTPMCFSERVMAQDSTPP